MQIGKNCSVYLLGPCVRSCHLMLPPLKDSTHCEAGDGLVQQLEVRSSEVWLRGAAATHPLPFGMLIKFALKLHFRRSYLGCIAAQL